MFCTQADASTENRLLYEAFERDDGTIDVAPQGGGFSKAYPRDVFDAKFVEVQANFALKKGKVTADFIGDAELPCYATGQLWNGWGMPLFEEAELLRVIELVNPQLATPETPEVLKWIDGKLHEYDWNEEQYYPCGVSDKVIDNKLVRLWSIGDGWTWDAVKFDEPAVLVVDKPLDAGKHAA